MERDFPSPTKDSRKVSIDFHRPDGDDSRRRWRLRGRQGLPGTSAGPRI